MINIVFGKPGSGKTTYIAYMSKKLRKRYKQIYSNVPIYNTIYINTDEFGLFQPEYHSAIFLDESAIEFNNRSYKSMQEFVIYFIKMHRHYKCDIYVVSQAYDDIDITFRRVYDQMYLLQKSWILPWFSYLSPIRKIVGVDDQTKQIIDQYEIVPFKKQFIFRPFYYKLFDSYSHKTLPSLEEVRAYRTDKINTPEKILEVAKKSLQKIANDDILKE